MKTFTTPNGKEVQITRNTRGDWMIQFATGGELHSSIQGTFTTEREAEKAVQVFLNMKEEQASKGRTANRKDSK